MNFTLNVTEEELIILETLVKKKCVLGQNQICENLLSKIKNTLNFTRRQFNAGEWRIDNANPAD